MKEFVHFHCEDQPNHLIECELPMIVMVVILATTLYGYPLQHWTVLIITFTVKRIGSKSQLTTTVIWSISTMMNWYKWLLIHRRVRLKGINDIYLHLGVGIPTWLLLWLWQSENRNGNFINRNCLFIRRMVVPQNVWFCSSAHRFSCLNLARWVH